MSAPEGEARRRTLRLDLEFDGTAFEGWQRQADARTVQGEVERALERVLGTAHGVRGCGRTDAGVHAEHLVASVRTVHAMPAADLERALDAVLPDDVGVLAVTDAAESFHAQRDALWKWYRYRILVSPRKHPLRRRRTWRRSRVPSLEALAAAAAPLQGRHDFASFANTGSTPGATTVRGLHALAWSRHEDELRLDVVGDGFLYKMVRTLVGTLLREAAGPEPAAGMRGVLEARDRSRAGAVAPAAGLTLKAVAMRGEAAARVPLPDWLRSRVDLQAQRSTGGNT